VGRWSRTSVTAPQTYMLLAERQDPMKRSSEHKQMKLHDRRFLDVMQVFLDRICRLISKTLAKQLPRWGSIKNSGQNPLMHGPPSLAPSLPMRHSKYSIPLASTIHHHDIQALSFTHLKANIPSSEASPYHETSCTSPQYARSRPS
jgi:hypothetical protein